MQYVLISDNPYKFTSDDVMFLVFAEREDIAEDDRDEARKEYFSKGRACFRASPLTKTYGFGLHNDKEGKIAVYRMESEQYQEFLEDKSVKKVKAMRSSRK